MTSSAELIAREMRHASGLWQPTIALVHGEGVRVYDADGRDYLDCAAGIAVASLGHGNERLATAIAEQARRLITCHLSMANDTRAAFLELLFEFVAGSPGGRPLERALLLNSGAEANEAALKYAMTATGRRRFVAAKRGFSGRSLGALALTWEESYRSPFAPFALEASFVRFNDVAELLAAIGPDVAGVLLEPVQGEGGIHEASAEFLNAARAACDEHGALLILDEIQAGVGRTGTFLASQAAGVQPDMVTLAKGLGGGVPLAALLMSSEVAAAMPRGGHGTTFGGNPLAAAAGLAVLQELRERDLMGNATAQGTRLMNGVRAIGSARVREVRGRGLLIGIELRERAGPVVAELRQAGLLTVQAGSNVVRLLPPLTIQADEVDEVLSRLAAVLGGNPAVSQEGARADA